MPFLLPLRATETLVNCFCGCKRPGLGGAQVFPMVFGGKTIETLAPPGTGRLKRTTIVSNVTVARNTSRKGMAILKII
jgi:hypothetical protein